MTVGCLIDPYCQRDRLGQPIEVRPTVAQLRAALAENDRLRGFAGQVARLDDPAVDGVWDDSIRQVLAAAAREVLG